MRDRLEAEIGKGRSFIKYTQETHEGCLQELVLGKKLMFYCCRDLPRLVPETQMVDWWVCLLESKIIWCI